MTQAPLPVIRVEAHRARRRWCRNIPVTLLDGADRSSLLVVLALKSGVQIGEEVRRRVRPKALARRRHRDWCGDLARHVERF